MADDRREVYFEFTPVGSVVRVAAIDAATGLEVTVMGPASAAQADLERLALQKLKARIAKGA
jgi:translation initiation factor 1 (eIF-1/SUI1)